MSITYDYENIVVGDRIRAYGNATGTVVSIDPRPNNSPIITYEAVYDIPAFRVAAGQLVKCDAKFCRKLGRD